ncbi:MAG: hypothetical protein KA736_00945 [Crocinitomicaceae bacterium]|nr:hypothetical protein [Crocinitomicaceae bacterium]MBP6032783.1 hypothetical protein [Crocinitomicaceae bacterium]
MKNHKFQQIRVRVTDFGESVRINAQTDKQYSKIRGIFVSLPDEQLLMGSLLGLRVNNQEVFEDAHEVKLITSGHQVAPNQKFFFFEEHLEAGGSAIEGKFTDGGEGVFSGNSAKLQLMRERKTQSGYLYEVKIYLWLTNE